MSVGVQKREYQTVRRVILIGDLFLYFGVVCRSPEWYLLGIESLVSMVRAVALISIMNGIYTGRRASTQFTST